MQAENSSRRFWLQYGDSCRLRNQWELAEQAYLEARQYGEDYGLWYRLGILYCQMLRFAEAVDCLNQANQLCPDQPEILFELARANYDLFDIQAAIQHYQQVLQLAPQMIKCWFYLAESYQALGQPQQARQALMAYLAQAQKQTDLLSPDQELASSRLQLLECSDQDIWRTWQLIAQLHHRAAYPPRSGQSWSGHIQPDQTLLIMAEHGLGDIIQMLRFLPALTELGQPYQLCLSPTSALKRLLSCLKHPVEVIAPKSLATDRPYLSLINLPLFPVIKPDNHLAVPYLYPDLHPERFLAPKPEQQLLKNASHPKIGLVWSSGHPKQRNRHWRYQQRKVGLAFFSELILAHPELNFYSLQVGPEAQELNHWPELPIINLGPELNDLYDTACLIQHFDLVISVDTAVAHLTGALGKPLWLLLPIACDERWGQNKAQTPWYPSARLFRQSVPFNWQAVLIQLQSALAEFSSLHTQHWDRPKIL